MVGPRFVMFRPRQHGETHYYSSSRPLPLQSKGIVCCLVYPLTSSSYRWKSPIVIIQGEGILQGLHLLLPSPSIFLLVALTKLTNLQQLMSIFFNPNTHGCGWICSHYFPRSQRVLKCKKISEESLIHRKILLNQCRMLCANKNGNILCLFNASEQAKFWKVWLNHNLLGEFYSRVKHCKCRTSISTPLGVLQISFSRLFQPPSPPMACSVQDVVWAWRLG